MNNFTYGGREEISRRMIALGATKQMAESKTVDFVIAAMTDDRRFKDALNLDLEIGVVKRELENLRSEISPRKRELQCLQDSIENGTDLFGYAQQQKIDELEHAISEFSKALSECETKEGRDTIRLAQTFINSVNVDTKYDNTAFIVGLAGILSNTKVDCVSELSKINTKLPQVLKEEIGLREISHEHGFGSTRR